MLAHDPAFGFHSIHISHKKAQKHISLSEIYQSSSISFCAFRDFLRPYSANQPLASRSLTPIRLLPSMSSIQEPLTSASSLPPNGGTSFTCAPSGTSTSMRSVAPPWLILTALAFAVKASPEASAPSTFRSNSTGTRGLRGRWDAISPRGSFSVIQSPPFSYWHHEEGLT